MLELRYLIEFKFDSIYFYEEVISLHKIRSIIILGCLFILLTGCGGLTKEDNAIIETVVNNTSTWYKGDTIHTQFVNYGDKLALEVWLLVSAPNPPIYPVERSYYEIDSNNDRMSLLYSETVGISMNRPLSNTDYYPKNSSIDQQKEYITQKYKNYKK